MSEFEQDIRQAKARQRRVYIYTFLAFVCTTGFLATVLFFMSGTTIKISPIEAEETGVIRVVNGYALAHRRVVYGLFGSPTINVGAKGFREQRRIISTEEQGNKIEITLIPKPGKILATTSPAMDNTKWILNGELSSVGKVFTRELKHG